MSKMSELDIALKDTSYGRLIYALCQAEDYYVVDSLLQQWQDNVNGRRIIAKLLDTLYEQVGERGAGLPEYHEAREFLEV